MGCLDFLYELVTKLPGNSGIGGGEITMLCPKSVPQTPQCEQAAKEQSGTTAASKARFKSSCSHFLSMPVSI